eukprot:scaffold54293_cov20-Tisochrysis_lutea.AAC.4
MTVVADDDQYVPPSGVIAVILASMSLQAGGYSTPQTSARLVVKLDSACVNGPTLHLSSWFFLLYAYAVPRTWNLCYRVWVAACGRHARLPCKQSIGAANSPLVLQDFNEKTLSVRVRRVKS